MIWVIAAVVIGAHAYPKIMRWLYLRRQARAAAAHKRYQREFMGLGE